jgi:hypothetical protein
MKLINQVLKIGNMKNLYNVFLKNRKTLLIIVIACLFLNAGKTQAQNVGITDATPIPPTFPNCLLQLHKNSASPISFFQFTNTLSGTTGSNGFTFDVDVNFNLTLNNRQSTSLGFNTNSFPRLTINNTGAVGINVIPAAGVVTPQLEVSSGATSDAIYGHSNQVGGYLGRETNITFGVPSQNIFGAGVYASNPVAGYTSMFAQSTGSATVAALISYSNVWIPGYFYGEDSYAGNSVPTIYGQSNVNVAKAFDEPAILGVAQFLGSGNAGYTIGGQFSSYGNTQDAIGMDASSFTDGSGWAVYGTKYNSIGTAQTIGFLASATIGAYGQYDINKYGYLGSSTQGVYGTNNTAAGVGVIGINSNTGTGIMGMGNTGGTGGSLYNGVGGSFLSNGTGIIGNYNSTTYYGRGVVGIGGGGTAAATSSDYGVLGVVGAVASAAGVGGYYGAVTLPPAACGTFGNSTTNTIYALRARNTTGNTGCGLYVTGTSVVTGTKSAVVPTSKGYQKLYCQESPEVWFEDIGSAKLVNGQVVINLDPLFIETVTIDESHPMHVFLQEEGESNGLIVIPGITSFTVKEKNNGVSNISFSYRILAKRRFYEDYHFGNVPQEGVTVDWTQYKKLDPIPIDYNEAYKFFELDKLPVQEKKLLDENITINSKVITPSDIKLRSVQSSSDKSQKISFATKRSISQLLLK